MTFGSLFAGIGGFDLGFERAGLRCVWQVELDGFCRQVLAKHWPDVPRWDDICTFPCEQFEVPDVICGGFPCQDISYAGKGGGLDGERSGLFFELVRVVREMGPRYVVLENVRALLTRGIDRVLGSLASLGYDAEWHCIPAAAVGAPHIRERVFVLAHANGVRWAEVEQQDQRRTAVSGEFCETLQPSQLRGKPSGWWETEPNVGRVAYGISSRVDRLRGLGNAVVPQVAEWIGKKLITQGGEPCRFA